MGQHTFLKLDKIKGDATDANHKDCIEIDSFSLNVTNKEDWDSKTDEGGGVKGSTVESISISKKLDSSSSDIFIKALNNEDISKGYIYLCRPKGDLGASSGLVDYMTFTLEDARLESYSLNGGSGWPSESLTLGFRTISWELKNEEDKRVGGGSYTKPDDGTQKK